jgi:hypothetical protein
MIKNLLYLSDGTCISSGVGQTNAIQNCTVTECVNIGEELTLGSTCCSCLELKIIAPGGGLNIPVGKEVRLCKAQDGGEPVQRGVFLPERPVKVNANVYKLTAYDKVSLLDKDVSVWLKGLKWPDEGYPLLTFAGMVCAACGLKLATTSIPNATMPVYQFYKAGVTGRQLMRWIGECAGRFCRANAFGQIEFAWYTSSGVTVRATGDRYYFAKGLTYEDYSVASIDAIKLRLADSEDGALWPEGAADNPYIITSNPILLAKVTTALEPYLKVLQSQLAALPTYRPCKVSLPASIDIQAGHTVQIVDKNGVSFTTCVMTKTQKGQKDTLKCTGSARRDSATAANNKTPGQVAQQAVDNQTHEEVFNKLTKNGTIQGIYVQDGKWYINAEQVVLQNLKVNAADITGVITVKDANGGALFTAGDKAVTLAGWNVDNNSIRHGDLGGSGSMWLCRTGTTSSPSSYGKPGIAETDATKTGWCITVGNNFGVDKDGVLYAVGANISGTVKTSTISCYSKESGLSPLFYVSSDQNYGALGGWSFYSGGLTRTYDDLILGDVTVTLKPESLNVTHSGKTYTKKWIDLVA